MTIKRRDPEFLHPDTVAQLQGLTDAEAAKPPPIVRERDGVHIQQRRVGRRVRCCEVEAPGGPASGRRMERHSRIGKTFRTRMGPIRIKRGYCHCRKCGGGAFPLDRALGLEGGRVDRAVAALKPCRDRSEDVAACIRTYKANRDRMRCDLCRKRGLPVGSGFVESACKLVVGNRLKGAGRHWSKAGANGLLAIRCCLENMRWPDFLDWKAVRAAAA